MTHPKILIADSGATKTDWCLVKNGETIHQFNAKGISPIFQSTEEIATVIKVVVYPQLKDKMPDAIYFYGSGCIPEKIENVKNAIQISFPIDKVEVYSDLVAAAHSLCGKKPGIACILGTGSNSCEWNGKEITHQISPLGFILGDEGSGANLGKLLVGDVLKNQLSEELKKKFLKQYDLTPAIIIENVYRKPFPSRFLSSVTPFLIQNIQDESIKSIVKKSFGDFFERNVMQYDYKNNMVSFVGSIAHYYSALLKEVAIEKGITIGKINQSPMEGLIDFYKSISPL
ncbi:MAG: ATPase [Bacteroidales bacterium]|nr:ATPase [Bacteroidales bacterium]